MDYLNNLFVQIFIGISLISLYLVDEADGTNSGTLMGGHRDNKNNNNNQSEADDAHQNAESYEYYDYFENNGENVKSTETIPVASPLVLPGYNLPDSIFNEGKPFYAEKDPITGKVDLNLKPIKSNGSFIAEEVVSQQQDSMSDNIYDKKNIDRKDGSLNALNNGHKQADINQLTPNFHDFLNLPVKYNPSKYVYPLISNSYASTKIQGSVNKYHNHKDTEIEILKPTTTKLPIVSYGISSTTPKSTTTTRRWYPESTTTEKYQQHHQINNQEDYDEYEDDFVTDSAANIQEVYLTTQAPSTSTSTTTTTTTERIKSIFEQLFGEYDETVISTIKTTKPIIKPSTTTTTTTTTTTPISSSSQNESDEDNNHVNVLTGSNMGLNNNYDYDYYNENIQDNIQVASNKNDDNLEVEPLNTVTKLTPVNQSRISDFKDKTTSTTTPVSFTTTTTVDTPTTYRPSSTTTTTPTTTTTMTTSRITSLPLGDNHISPPPPPFNKDPIIVATQNLRDKLNSEKVDVLMAPPSSSSSSSHSHPSINQLAPSASKIHIAPGQDTVSFVVGHHQSVGGGDADGLGEHRFQYKENLKPSSSETLVTIQPLQNSEASLAIGRPITEINKQIPGQVMDDTLEHHVKSTKVVFPDDLKSVHSNVIPSSSRPTSSQVDREILKLNSKPMYHQLPSDLTPPRRENHPPSWGSVPVPAAAAASPSAVHFYTGKPDYLRPTRPIYKRIDNLPNILPQFRPNMNLKPPHPYHHHHHFHATPPPPPSYLNQRFNRQPLLERPSNNRPISYNNNMYPPPPKNQIMIRHPTPYEIDDRRPVAQQPSQNLDASSSSQIAEDRIMNEDPLNNRRHPSAPSSSVPELNIIMYQTPPNLNFAHRRHAESEIETLQMIQAKNEKDNNNNNNNNNGENNKKEKSDTVKVVVAEDEDEVNSKEKEINTTEKPVYKVYPVNNAATAAEISSNNNNNNKDFHFQHHIIKDRNDAPILKPHPRPSQFPSKLDFPYPLERPDSSLPLIHHAQSPYNNNQWNSVGGVGGGELNSPSGSGKISATLKTYTSDKPIAIAYTPTAEPHHHHHHHQHHQHLTYDKYSMPNYGSPVIPEIRPGIVDNAETGYDEELQKFNHKIDLDIISSSSSAAAAAEAPKSDFQAPFLPSVNLDGSTNNQGWSVVVKEKNKTSSISPIINNEEETEEITTLPPPATTSEFDIENFKPQLIGGFKPLYSLPEDVAKDAVVVADRKE